MVRIFAKALFFLLLLASQTARAQDQCKSILEQGITNSTTTINKSSSAQADKSYYCQSNYNEAKNYFEKRKASGQEAEGGVSYGIFSADAGGSTNDSESTKQDNFNKWKSQNCGGADSSQSAAAFQYHAQSVVAVAVVEAWRDCMIKREGLSCWASPTPDQVNITINWRRNSSIQAKVFSSSVENGTATFDGKSGPTLLPSGMLLDPGEIVIPVRRSGREHIGVTFVLNHAGANQACQVYVPALPAPPVPLHARVRVQLNNFGCSTGPGKGNCTNHVLYGPAPGFRLCRLDQANLKLSPPIGVRGKSSWFDVQAAQNGAWIRVSATAGLAPDPTGESRYKALPDPVFAFGDVTLSEIAGSASGEDRRQAGCNVATVQDDRITRVGSFSMKEGFDDVVLYLLPSGDLKVQREYFGEVKKSRTYKLTGNLNILSTPEWAIDTDFAALPVNVNGYLIR